jgi:hypothetical protein
MLRIFRSVTALWMFLALFSSPLQALDPNYNFEVLTVNGQTIDGLTVVSIQLPQIDNFGKVVFFGGYQAGTTFGSALFTPSTVLVKSGDNIGGHILAGVSPFALDPVTGELAFIANDQSGASLLFSKRDRLQTRLLASSGEKIDDLTLKEILSVAVNANGFIAFGATYTDSKGNSGTGVFAPGWVLAKTGQVIDGNVTTSIGTSFVGLSLENVYFVAGTNTGARGIFTTHKAVVKTGESIGGNQITSIDYPAVNEFGNLVFAADTTSGAGLFNPPRVVFTQTYPLDAFPAAINDFGVLAYGVPAGVNVNNSLLIAYNDTIGTNVINGFGFPVSLNDRDQVAIPGNIAGAADALILATPKHHLHH